MDELYAPARPFLLVLVVDRQKKNQLIQLIETQIIDFPATCREVYWLAGPKILQVFIDAEEGVSLELCAQISRKIEAPIEALIEDSFHLEVSSPGLDSPLRTWSHFEQAMGQQVKIHLTEAVNERKSGRGRLSSLDQSSKTLTIETSRGPWTFSWELLDHAQVIYDWEGQSHV